MKRSRTAALLLMAPAALTSFDWAQKWLGQHWRSLHLLTVPALILSVLHAILIGSHYLGAMQLTAWNWASALGLGGVVLGVLLLRRQWIWSLFSLEKNYVPPTQNK